ncbi:MAG: hypothetical protein MUO26_05410 [Methanotrichaceae archaeon]|nr:hypothetical protein [Methanotrichaceae archaeon]
MQNRSRTLKNIEFSKSDLDSEEEKEDDLIKLLVGLICSVIVDGNHVLSARLLRANDSELWLKNRYGRTWMVARARITAIRPVKNQVPDPSPESERG